MSELDKLKAQISLGKVPLDKVHPEWPYQRAWNDALAWIEQQISKIEKGQS